MLKRYLKLTIILYCILHYRLWRFYQHRHPPPSTLPVTLYYHCTSPCACSSWMGSQVAVSDPYPCRCCWWLVSQPVHDIWLMEVGHLTAVRVAGGVMECACNPVNAAKPGPIAVVARIITAAIVTWKFWTINKMSPPTGLQGQCCQTQAAP